MASAIFSNFSNQSSNYLDLAAKHQASISASLHHRQEIARANQNFDLLSLLEQERQQLNPQTQKSSRSIWNWLFEPMEISIEKLPSGNGEVIWRGYNPQTGETRYGESEADMIAWLEQ
ncbi:hypothetical protein Syn7502_02736 [Synechococcus sp. PCC 7502]|uniref:hypothetical protein n=1 Tax=Synechococcus sp. PCC 7502 TaxID=1173263 RepID=UPI00029FC853|nr:hypothetical protein [Synechococcus sp. PCC 7502]AFY74682.1 hypothetical protein Syn7502_02736 [Synechococcus sp. PCC 7502]